MSILIKGMEMPKSCDDCWFECAYEICTPETGYENCPLVEVPTPHGRLIDADCCNDYFYEHMSDDMMIAAMNAINEMPTIIPADKEEYKCESCVYNPPSSCDGKPCTQCDTRNPLTNCYIPADKGGKK